MFNIQIDSHQIFSVIVLSTIFLFETLFPFREYLDRVRHYSKNIVFSILNGIITSLVSAFATIAVLLYIEKYAIGLLQNLNLSAFLTTVIALLIFDLWIYTWHRLNHQIPFLWRFHQVHHNDIEMDMSTALRFHPGEVFISSILNIGIFLIFGLSMEQVILYKAIFHTNVMIHHSNIGISPQLDKILRLVIVSPNTHRVHHSIKQEETDSNFSSVLTLWDRICGTYRENEPENIVFGLEIDREEECQTLPYLLKLPFKRSQKISVSKAKDLIQNEKVILIDARMKSDYQKSHIEGAIFLDKSTLDNFIENTDRTSKILCYCYKGVSSKGLCYKLHRAGFKNVLNLKGGYSAWCKATPENVQHT